MRHRNSLAESLFFGSLLMAFLFAVGFASPGPVFSSANARGRSTHPTKTARPDQAKPLVREPCTKQPKSDHSKGQLEFHFTPAPPSGKAAENPTTQNPGPPQTSTDDG